MHITGFNKGMKAITCHSLANPCENSKTITIYRKVITITLIKKLMTYLNYI